MTREEKLEELGKAAMRLRKAITVYTKPEMKVGTVPVEAIQEFDKSIKRLKEPK